MYDYYPPDQLMAKAREIRRLALEKGRAEIQAEITSENEKRKLNNRDAGRYVPSLTQQEVDRIYEGVVSFIIPLFEDLSRLPNPDSFQGPISQMSEAKKTLSPGDVTSGGMEGGSFSKLRIGPAVAGVNRCVDTWQGKAAQEFRRHFLEPFPGIQKNQFALAHVLEQSMVANQRIFIEARKAVKAVVDSTITALKDVGGCPPSAWAVTFAIITASVGILSGGIGGAIGLFTVAASAHAIGKVSTGITSGLGIASGATSAVGALSSYSDAKKAEQAAKKYGGDTVREIMQGLQDAVADVRKQITDAERAIMVVLDALANWMETSEGEHDGRGPQPIMHRFSPPRPNLANATQGNVKSPDYLGVTA